MNNIIQSDLYRIRKGVAMRNTLIAILGITILAAIVLSLTGSGVFQGIIENELVNGVATEGERLGLEGDMMDMNEMMRMLPQSGAAFAKEMLSGDTLSLLALIIAIAVMGADFGAGTFRNTLSYESDRKKVYLGKLVVNLILILVLMVANLLFSCLVGGVFFGFGGLTGEFLLTSLTGMLLQLPIFMAFLAFAQCLLAFTQKSGATIAAYLLFVIFFSGIVQFASMLLPTVRWILLLDLVSDAKLMTSYQTAAPTELIASQIIAFCVLIGTTALGMARYCKADMH